MLIAWRPFSQQHLNYSHHSSRSQADSQFVTTSFSVTLLQSTFAPGLQVSSRIPAHKDDVNAVAWADDSGNVVLSGSDDCLCKVLI